MEVKVMSAYLPDFTFDIKNLGVVYEGNFTAKTPDRLLRPE